MPYEAVRLGGAVLGLSFGSNPSQNQSLQWQKWPPLRLPLGDDSAGRTPTFGFKLPILQGKSMFRKMGFTITLFGLVGGLLATEPQPPRRIGRIVEGVVGRSVNFADRIVQAATGKASSIPPPAKPPRMEFLLDSQRYSMARTLPGGTGCPITTPTSWPPLPRRTVRNFFSIGPPTPKTLERCQRGVNQRWSWSLPDHRPGIGGY